jgi:hypothetical protein
MDASAQRLTVRGAVDAPRREESSATLYFPKAELTCDECTRVMNIEIQLALCAQPSDDGLLHGVWTCGCQGVLAHKTLHGHMWLVGLVRDAKRQDWWAGWPRWRRQAGSAFVAMEHGGNLRRRVREGLGLWGRACLTRTKSSFVLVVEQIGFGRGFEGR